MKVLILPSAFLAGAWISAAVFSLVGRRRNWGQWPHWWYCFRRAVEVRVLTTGDLELLPVLETLMIELRQVGQKDLERAERKLKPLAHGETALGTVHNELARRMWALADIEGAKRDEHTLAARSRAENQEEADALYADATRCDALEDVAREAFWVQAREDMSAWKSGERVGLRAGWMLVALKEERRSFPQFLGAVGLGPGGPQ